MTPAPTARDPRVALTIAGSDSGGGAGIQADLATFAALGVHGTSALTAVTVQDTTGVHGIHPVPLDVIEAQVACVTSDYAVASVKTGMLGSVDVVRLVARLAAQDRLPLLVVDPVAIATSGDRLTGTDALQAIATDLLPHATLATPNVEEAAALLGTEPATSLARQREHALALAEKGCAVVVTGRVDGRDRVDVLARDGTTRELRGPAIATPNDHGTGCTFAAAAAAVLANGGTVLAAVTAAQQFVRAALDASASWRLGHGAGPVSHLLPSTPRTLPIQQGA